MCNNVKGKLRDADPFEVLRRNPLMDPVGASLADASRGHYEDNDPPPPPPPPGESPEAAAARAADKANQDAVKSRLSTQRRRRALSLLAAGAEGDAKAPSTSRPAAGGGKQQLGS